MSTRRTTFVLLLCGLVLGGLVPRVRADSITIGFEPSEGYATGSIDKQPSASVFPHDWAGTLNIAINPSIDQAVSTAGSCTGTQSFRMSSSTTSGSFGDFPFSPSLTDEAGETGAVRANCSSTPQSCQVNSDCPGTETCLVYADGSRQTRFTAAVHFKSVTATPQDSHVVISPDRGDGARMSWIEISDNVSPSLACVGGDLNGESCTAATQMTDCPNTTNDTTTGCTTGAGGFCLCQPDGRSGLSVSFSDYRTTTNPSTQCLDGAVNGVDGQGKCFTFAVLATNLSRTTCHRIDLTMDFIDGQANDVVRVSVDGGAAFTGTSWEDFFRNNQNPPFSAPPPVDSLLFRAGGSAEGTAGNGFFFDDVSYASGPTPTTTTTTTPSTTTTTVPPCRNLNVTGARIRPQSSPAAGNGSIVLKGDFVTSPPGDTFDASAPITARVRDSASLDQSHTWMPAQCSTTTGRIRCSSSNARADFRSSPRTPNVFRFNVTLKGLAIDGPFQPPVSATLKHDTGATRCGTDTECRQSRAGLTCR
jgi:hypothetical protein